MGKQAREADAICETTEGTIWHVTSCTSLLATSSDTLIGWGFKLNEYDKCVANKMINGKQCTIIWHVDDLKISHVEQKLVKDIIKRLEDKFGQESPLETSQGKTIDYLGMCIDYTVKGKVKISMYEYIDKMLAELPSDMNRVSTTPAALHLFNVDDSARKLDKDGAQLFHHLVAKLLYLSRRSRQDIQTAVAFLCTRVQSPDVDDYKKLARVMKYIRGTKDIMLTIEANDGPKWWVDSSYAVHPDMRSHSGIFVTLGKGTAYAASNKQKLRSVLKNIKKNDGSGSENVTRLSARLESKGIIGGGDGNSRNDVARGTKNEIQNTQSAQRFKYSCAQECVEEYKEK